MKLSHIMPTKNKHETRLLHLLVKRRLLQTTLKNRIFLSRATCGERPVFSSTHPPAARSFGRIVASIHNNLCF
ncbi:hypothetical protein E2C01_045038 [Portunus trituberculatus]|uniref:Uncharacterized protein n=1 Tax=Portunus trituberculatus TaxID=210409 RepID=A0A5B7G0Q4_PORTR|nr:hypothetical protein [Portunus trituberculatus]